MKSFSTGAFMGLIIRVSVSLSTSFALGLPVTSEVAEYAEYTVF